jgi:cell fate regulator YaaT (PSP1 superfamily)
MSYYFARYGTQGHVGVFESRLGVAFQHGAKVVCRTDRGTEAALVLNQVENEAAEVAGTIVRPFTHNDELLAERLQRYQGRAFASCSQVLRDRGIDVPLIDVEQLHDGENLFFYFLGEVDSSLEAVLEELADCYGKKIRFRQFAEKLASGCGPNCGTGESKCSTGACSSCGMSGKCSTSAASGPAMH